METSESNDFRRLQIKSISLEYELRTKSEMDGLNKTYSYLLSSIKFLFNNDFVANFLTASKVL